MLKQMGALATSKVCILDSYCIPVSLLTHKKDLTVIQIWHAIGLMKKAGYSILGKAEGRDARTARLLHMHMNYDIAFASSELCRQSMSEVFACPVENVQVYLLPRVDALRDQDYAAQKREEIFCKYPTLADSSKKNILYIPTQRKDETMLMSKTRELMAAVDYSRYNLIIKPHPLSSMLHELRGTDDTDERPRGTDDTDERPLFEEDFTSMDMLFAADFVVADYSGMLFDVLACGKPLYFYAFDYDEYLDRRGWFIDYAAEIPGSILSKGTDVIARIESGDFDEARAEAFFKKYVTVPDKSVTEIDCELVEERL
jgi:CDP-ribitol ribitolphosphotransferase